MNLLDIVNEELDTDTEYILDEGMFEVSPAIAMFAFKDKVVGKIKSTAKKVTDPVSNVIGKTIIGKEKVKAALTGKSGSKDDDVVYKLSKEQKETLAYIYKKYGPEMVNKITQFRKDILLPYQIIKKNVAKNHSLTNKEAYGMSKEEYYKYRESGRKKIEAKGNFFKDAKETKEGISISKNSLENAKKMLSDFNQGKIVKLSSTNIEKILDSIGIGRSKLYGWSDSELEKTATKIKEYEGYLKDPKRIDENGNIRVSGVRNSARATKKSREMLENEIQSMYEHGISYTNNKTDEEGRKNKGPFKEAFANYLLRRENISSMEQNMSNARFRKFYSKVLKDAVNSANKVYKEKINSLVNLKGKSELNKMEKKIWGLKLTGTKYSGNINDWYLKIKPEDFMDNTKYYDKPKEVINAEKEFDRLLKQLERDLKKVMSDDDVALCRKYKLFNNFLTVKQFKNSKDMFKNGKELKELKKDDINNSNEDFEQILTNANNKEYNSIKDLEDVQNKIKKMAPKNMSKKVEAEYKSFISRIDPKNNSEISKIDRKGLTSIINKIENTDYEGITKANEDLDKLEQFVVEFKKKNGEEEYSKYKYDIQKARNKINGYLQGQED